MGTVLASLAAQTALDAQIAGDRGDRVPEWASRAPRPASRVQSALVMAGTGGEGMTNRDAFLARVEGADVWR